MSLGTDSGVPFWAAGITRRCPRCGKGRLYDRYLVVRQACGDCGLDYTEVDTGDGPAVFIILIVGFLVVGAALAVEMTFQPPYWLHLVLWLPLILILSLGMLPLLKATFVALAYRNRNL
ncbi:MAG: DUF983 domain-containing protein [Rhodospirillales bacterium]|nr:DUF983 domain-containing protein [Rhodospirillales bacterium]